MGPDGTGWLLGRGRGWGWVLAGQERKEDELEDKADGWFWTWLWLFFVYVIRGVEMRRVVEEEFEEKEELGVNFGRR